MRGWIIIWFVAFGCASATAQRTITLTPAVATSEPRVALVVGNAAYKESPLTNPVNDANDVASALRDLGFKVFLLRDGNTRDMRQAIREWGAELRRARVGLFYFAGHGVQIRGNNYLLPVATAFGSEADVEDLAIDANYAVRTMEESQVEVSIVILDACRNNPFARSFRSTAAGLAQMTAAKGTVIAFATAPGSVASDGKGRNGTYTRNLLDNLRQSDTDILKVFQRTRAGVVKDTGGKQMPWESTSLIGDFHFRPQVVSATQVAIAVQPAPGAAPSLVPAVIPAADAALDSATFLEDLEAFIAQHKAPVSELERLSQAQDPLGSARYCAVATHERFNLGVAVNAGLAHCKRLSDAGVAAGQFFYARAFMFGRGVAKDYDQAIKLYRQSAEQGFPLAMNNLGSSYYEGIGVAKDMAEGLRWIRRAAETGSPVGMLNLGTRYMQGQGVTKDEVQAVAWTRKAAELGEVNAMVSLGNMYKSGRGVAQDHAQAIRWFQRGADAGGGAAMAEMGMAYSRGVGVAQNFEEAARWNRRAAERGDLTGQFNLGINYRDGKGVPRDFAEAARLLRIVADTGNASGMAALGDLYVNGWGVPKDEAEASRLFRAAADKGDAAAMNKLGNHYQFGRGGVAKDEEEAARWFRKAVEGGDGYAMSNLGYLYQYGKGVARNEQEAVRLYRMAVEHNNSYGFLNLGAMYADGRGGLTRDVEQAATLYRQAVATGDATIRAMAEKNLKAIGK
jgi:TPR repeat protein